MRKARPRRSTIAALVTCYVCHGLGYLTVNGKIMRLCPLCHGAGFNQEVA